MTEEEAKGENSPAPTASDDELNHGAGNEVVDNVAGIGKASDEAPITTVTSSKKRSRESIEEAKNADSNETINDTDAAGDKTEEQPNDGKDSKKARLNENEKDINIQTAPPSKSIFGSSAGFAGFQTAELATATATTVTAAAAAEAAASSKSIFGSNNGSTSGFSFATNDNATGSIFGSQSIFSKNLTAAASGFGLSSSSVPIATSTTTAKSPTGEKSASVFGSSFTSSTTKPFTSSDTSTTNDNKNKGNINSDSNDKEREITPTTATTKAAMLLPQATEPISNGEENEKTVYTIRAKVYKLQNNTFSSASATNNATTTTSTATSTVVKTGIQCATKVGNDSNTQSPQEEKAKVNWKEVGIGPLKILTSNNTATASPITARIVQRRESTPGGPGTKLILNIMLKKECIVEKKGDTFVKLAAFEIVNGDGDGDGEDNKDDKVDIKLKTVQYLFKVKTISDADALLQQFKKFCK